MTLPSNWRAVSKAVKGTRHYCDLVNNNSGQRVSTLEDLIKALDGTGLSLKNFKYLNKTVGPKLFRIRRKRELMEKKGNEAIVYQLIMRGMDNRVPEQSYDHEFCDCNTGMFSPCLPSCRCLECLRDYEREEEEVKIIRHKCIYGYKMIKQEPLDPPLEVDPNPSQILINTTDLTTSLMTPTTHTSAMMGVNDRMTYSLSQNQPFMREEPPRISNNTSLVFCQPSVICSSSSMIFQPSNTGNHDLYRGPSRLEELHTVYGNKPSNYS